MSKREERIEVNRKMIGKSVRVSDETGIWFGMVEDVKDEDTFLVRDAELLREASIYDIRPN